MFRFTDDCVLGVEVIDDEHRHLFDLINRGKEMLENEYGGDRYSDIKELLEELEEYAEEHFAHEEQYMEKICDPELILQRSQHMYFKEKVIEFLVQNIDKDEEQQRVLGEVMEFLARWLYQHIIGSDIMIGKLPPLALEIVALVAAVLFLTDCVATFCVLANLQKRLEKAAEKLYKVADTAKEKWQAAVLKAHEEHLLHHFNWQERRIIMAFPQLKLHRHDEILKAFREISARRRKK